MFKLVQKFWSQIRLLVTGEPTFMRTSIGFLLSFGVGALVWVLVQQPFESDPDGRRTVTPTEAVSTSTTESSSRANDASRRRQAVQEQTTESAEPGETGRAINTYAINNLVASLNRSAKNDGSAVRKRMAESTAASLLARLKKLSTSQRDRFKRNLSFSAKRYLIDAQNSN